MRISTHRGVTQVFLSLYYALSRCGSNNSYLKDFLASCDTSDWRLQVYILGNVVAKWFCNLGASHSPLSTLLQGSWLTMSTFKCHICQQDKSKAHKARHETCLVGRCRRAVNHAEHLYRTWGIIIARYTCEVLYLLAPLRVCPGS